MGKMEEDKIPIQPFLHGPNVITPQSDRAFGELREFLKRHNIFKYGLILTQIPSRRLIVQLAESKWYNLVVLPTLSSITNDTALMTMGLHEQYYTKKENRHMFTPRERDFMFTNCVSVEENQCKYTGTQLKQKFVTYILDETITTLILYELNWISLT